MDVTWASEWIHDYANAWRSGDDERVVILTAFAHMIALDAKTGKPVPSFGRNGWVDLAEGLRRPVDRDYYTMSSPPVIVRDVIVVGSSVMDWWGHRPSPPGHQSDCSLSPKQRLNKARPGLWGLAAMRPSWNECVPVSVAGWQTRS